MPSSAARGTAQRYCRRWGHLHTHRHGRGIRRPLRYDDIRCLAPLSILEAARGHHLRRQQRDCRQRCIPLGVQEELSMAGCCSQHKRTAVESIVVE